MTSASLSSPCNAQAQISSRTQVLLTLSHGTTRVLWPPPLAIRVLTAPKEPSQPPGPLPTHATPPGFTGFSSFHSAWGKQTLFLLPRGPPYLVPSASPNTSSSHLTRYHPGRPCRPPGTPTLCSGTHGPTDTAMLGHAITQGLCTAGLGAKSDEVSRPGKVQCDFCDH